MGLLQVCSLAVASFWIFHPKLLPLLTLSSFPRLRMEGSSRKCLCCILRLELQRDLQIGGEDQGCSSQVWWRRYRSVEFFILICKCGYPMITQHMIGSVRVRRNKQKQRPNSKREKQRNIYDEGDSFSSTGNLSELISLDLSGLSMISFSNWPLWSLCCFLKLKGNNALWSLTNFSLLWSHVNMKTCKFCKFRPITSFFSSVFCVMM